MRRLARSSTCSSLLIINQTYDNDSDSQMLFERELDLAFFCSEGFDEAVYRNAYNQIEQNRQSITDSNINDNVPVIDLTTNEETNESRANQQDSNDSNERLNGKNKQLFKLT